MNAPEDNAHVDEETSQSVAPEHDVSPLVLPMKAALYFDSADGFGEWRILLSTRVDGDLRQARKRDKKMFKIYVKKIKYVWGDLAYIEVLTHIVVPQGIVQWTFLRRQSKTLNRPQCRDPDLRSQDDR